MSWDEIPKWLPKFIYCTEADSIFQFISCNTHKLSIVNVLNSKLNQCKIFIPSFLAENLTSLALGVLMKAKLLKKQAKDKMQLSDRGAAK